MDNINSFNGGAPSFGPSPQIQQAVFDAPLITCECGSKIFTTGTILKKVPGIYFGASSEPVIIPTNLYVCAKCGKIMKEQLEDKEFIGVMGKKTVDELSGKESSDGDNVEQQAITSLFTQI